MSKTTKERDFARPHDVGGMNGLVGAGREVYDLMPAMGDIPPEFERWGNPFNKLASEWFFGRLSKWPLNPKPGIDHKKALAHLSAIQRSWTPKHEHKTAAVAYLMSLWYEAPKSTGHKGKPL